MCVCVCYDVGSFILPISKHVGWGKPNVAAWVIHPRMGGQLMAEGCVSICGFGALLEGT